APMVTVHACPSVASQPSHSLKIDPRAGVAVRVTVEPYVNGAAHVVPQSIPPDADVTVPEPTPGFSTVSTNCDSLKAAPTAFAPSIVRLQNLPFGVHPVQE